MPTTAIELTDDITLLLARRVCYRFIATALMDSLAGVFADLNDPVNRELICEAARIIREDDRAVVRPLAFGERPLADLQPEIIYQRLPSSASEFNALYERTFGLLGGSRCPPYETEYIASKFAFQRSNSLADIAGFYRAFGLQTSSCYPDRPDHVALHCEFVAQLIQLEWRAAQKTEFNVTDVVTCQQARERFVREHIVWWMPAFARVLAHQNQGNFYESVAHFLAAFVAAERALIGIAPPETEQLQPNIIEHPDECSGCHCVFQ